jgi:hypothetical protein
MEIEGLKINNSETKDLFRLFNSYRISEDISFHIDSLDLSDEVDTEYDDKTKFANAN